MQRRPDYTAHVANLLLLASIGAYAEGRAAAEEQNEEGRRGRDRTRHAGTVARHKSRRAQRRFVRARDFDGLG